MLFKFPSLLTVGRIIRLIAAKASSKLFWYSYPNFQSRRPCSHQIKTCKYSLKRVTQEGLFKQVLPGNQLNRAINKLNLFCFSQSVRDSASHNLHLVTCVNTSGTWVLDSVALMKRANSIARTYLLSPFNHERSRLWQG